MEKRKILFISCPEHGQLNCHLAVISSLLQTRASEVDLHLATFESASGRCPPGVQFHALPGKGVGQRFKDALASAQDPQRVLDTKVFVPPGLWGTLVHALPRFGNILNPETADEYVDGVLAAMRVIEEVQPDLVVVDVIFSQGRDAILKLGTPYLVLSPGTLKENANQGWNFFTWPASNTGWRYPVPWYLAIPNILVCLAVPIYMLLIDKKIKAINRARKAKLGITALYPLFAPPSVPLICMATPAIEYPGSVPPHIRAVGPILQAAKPLEEVDKELYDWVMQGPVVLIVLGSHIGLTNQSAKEVFGAIATLLRARQDVRVLLRYYTFGTFDLPIDAAEFGDRLRTPSWLEADPVSILATGKVAAFVSHAGSNSWHEGVRMAVPQICLPAWFDCYDFARKTEWLGIGRWANKKSAPQINEKELADAFLDVVGKTPYSPSAFRYSEKAVEVREIVMGNRDLTGVEVNGVKRKGREGRDVAADICFEEASKSRAK